MNNEVKKKVAETIKNLEQAVLDNDLACMFMYESELSALVGDEISMAILGDITEANQNKGKVVVDVYLNKIFSEGGE
ncbi:hypothetical protein [Gracilibacillus lacisalsi]|uniref:hypothetical protein n=1 Tax=Gracilibacillus lacisalsi TaxID=393087 RepID=UPI0003637981|nr:hypothetical protein [Gracilibacillus lacisalsi]